MNVFHIGHCFAAEKLSNHFESRILFVYLSLLRLLIDKSFRLLKSLTLSSFSCKYFCLNIQYSIISLNNKLFSLVPFRSNLNSPKRRSFYPMFLHVTLRHSRFGFQQSCSQASLLPEEKMGTSLQCSNTVGRSSFTWWHN